MAYSVNYVALLGNVGKDPEVRYTQAGKAVANLSLATSKKYNDKEETTWHNLVIWDKAAEIIKEHVFKGSKLYVQGEIQVRKWQDRDGNNRETTEIVVREFVILDGRPGSAQGQPQGRGSAPAPSGASDPNDESIPF